MIITTLIKGLGKAEVDADVRKAFNMWARASGLSFIRSQYGAVDIEIRFESYYHGDEDAFDGPGGKFVAKIKQFHCECFLSRGGCTCIFP